MADYRIYETEQFSGDLEKDFEGQGARIEKKLRGFVYPQLRKNPHYGKNIKKLKNYTPDTWRYRVGGYRFFYEIDDAEKTVYMVAADARKDSY